MTIRDFFKKFSIASDQRVYITDCTLHQSYLSNSGDFCFENSSNLIDGDYEKTINHILRLKVIRFEFTLNKIIWIYAE